MSLGGGRRRDAGRIALLLALIIPSLPARGAAQIAEDTAGADSLARDTVDYTARFLKAQEQATVAAAVLPRLEQPGPRPPFARIVFDRDSIEWGHAVTVGDLLARVPGVYIWRGGWFGRPEPVSYQGRGSASAEYYLDGLPYVAAGPDSLAVDPGLLSTSFLDRIEVERGPGQVRVLLFTRRHDRLAPRSRIAVARGDRDFARYEGELERRFRSGLGLALAADYLSVPTASGVSSTYSNTQLWVQGSYVPSGRFGLQYQLVRSRPNRRPFVTGDPLTGVEDTIGLGYDATRTDAQVRLTFKRRADDLGPRADLLYGRTGWSGAGVEQQINQIGGQLAYRAPTFSVGASGFHRTRWTALDLRGTAGWNAALLSASAEAVLRHHYGGRTSRWIAGRVGVEPVRGLALTGTARVGREVAAPALIADTAQEVRDGEVALGWERSRLGLRLAYSHTGAFAPYAFPEYPRIPSLAPSPSADWLTVSAYVAPVRWLALSGWYSDPTGAASVDGVPPTHSLAAVTFRSRFLRQFPSGIFDLELRLAAESWGTGTAGRDAAGAAVALRGATFLRSLIQFRLQNFIVFWDRGNLTATDLTYVPGFRLPSYGSTFGVRWEFSN